MKTAKIHPHPQKVINIPSPKPQKSKEVRGTGYEGRSTCSAAACCGIPAWPNARSALLFVKPHVGAQLLRGEGALTRAHEPRSGSLYQRGRGDRAERVCVRRRCSLWLAGGWWRGAPPTPGSEHPPHLPRRGCPTSERCPPGNGCNGRTPTGGSTRSAAATPG